MRAGDPVTVCSDYPDVFLGAGVTVERFSRERINVLAHYVAGKPDTRTTQWEDVQRSAGVSGLALAFAWSVRNAALVDRLREMADGRPLVLVHGGRPPMARADRFGMDLLPEREAFRAVLKSLGDCFRVRVGAGPVLYGLPCDHALGDSTTVSDLLDLGRACDGVVAQCSFAVPLAEVFDRPLLAVWSAAGLASPVPYVRQIRPQKILSKPLSRSVLDSASPDMLALAAMFFRESLCAS